MGAFDDSAMSSVVEDPGIPLVGMNGNHVQYKTLNESTDSVTPKVIGRFETVGSRLAKRKELYYRRKRANDAALGFAIAGIFLMIIETELTHAGVFTRRELPSYLIKMMVTASTVALLIFLFIYHRLDVKLFIVDNSVDDWKIAMSPRRVVKIVVEFCTCIIHPIPGDFTIWWERTVSQGEISRTDDVPLDVVLSLPMFLRLYLVCRTVMLHSRLYQDASSQSLGALNRIHFNFRFIFKSFMAVHPTYILTLIIVCMFFVASWCLRLCEMYDSSPDEAVHANYLNSMWLVAITFLSVGYGDIVPSTYCGRGIAVTTGIFGAGVTALVVAVLARKLELSRSEKYVHDFVIDVDLDKRLKNEAANVMRSGWFIYKYRRIKQNSSNSLNYQRKLLEAIYNIREIKAAQRRLVDSSTTLVELYKSHSEMARSVENVKVRQGILDDKMDNLESKILSIHEKLNAIHTAVTQKKI